MLILKEIFNKNRKVFYILLAIVFLVILILSYVSGKNKDSSDSPYFVSKETNDLNNNGEEAENNQEQNNGSVFSNPETESKEGVDSIDFKEMAKNEKDYADVMKRFYDTYPDYGKMPIDKDEYVILFDLERDKYRIILKVNSTSSKEVISTLTAKALEDLTKTIGKMVGQKSYYVLFLDNYEKY